MAIQLRRISRPIRARPRHPADGRRRRLGHEVAKLSVSRDTAKPAARRRLSGGCPCRAPSQSSTVVQQNSLGPAAPQPFSGSPAGSQKSPRIMRQDWTKRVRFSCRASASPRRRDPPEVVGSDGWKDIDGLRGTRSQPRAEYAWLMGWRGGGDRTRGVDDTHDGQHRTR